MANHSPRSYENIQNGRSWPFGWVFLLGGWRTITLRLIWEELRITQTSSFLLDSDQPWEELFQASFRFYVYYIDYTMLSKADLFMVPPLPLVFVLPIFRCFWGTQTAGRTSRQQSCNWPSDAMERTSKRCKKISLRWGGQFNRGCCWKLEKWEISRGRARK